MTTRSKRASLGLAKMVAIQRTFSRYDSGLHSGFGESASEVIINNINRSGLPKSPELAARLTKVLVKRYGEMPGAAMNFTAKFGVDSFRLTKTESERYINCIDNDRISNALGRFKDNDNVIHYFSDAVASVAVRTANGKDKGNGSMDAVIESLNSMYVDMALDQFKGRESMENVIDLLSDALGKDIRVVKKVSELLVAMKDCPSLLDTMRFEGHLVDDVVKDLVINGLKASNHTGLRDALRVA